MSTLFIYACIIFCSCSGSGDDVFVPPPPVEEVEEPIEESPKTTEIDVDKADPS